MTEPDVDALIVYYEKMRDDRTRVAKNAVTTEGRLALIASSNRAQDTAAALRTLQDRCKSLERVSATQSRVNADLNDAIDLLENQLAEWRGDRTT